MKFLLILLLFVVGGIFNLTAADYYSVSGSATLSNTGGFGWSESHGGHAIPRVYPTIYDNFYVTYDTRLTVEDNIQVNNLTFESGGFGYGTLDLTGLLMVNGNMKGQFHRLGGGSVIMRSRAGELDVEEFGGEERVGGYRILSTALVAMTGNCRIQGDLMLEGNLRLNGYRLVAPSLDFRTAGASTGTITGGPGSKIHVLTKPGSANSKINLNTSSPGLTNLLSEFSVIEAYSLAINQQVHFTNPFVIETLDLSESGLGSIIISAKSRIEGEYIPGMMRLANYVVGELVFGQRSNIRLKDQTTKALVDGNLPVDVESGARISIGNFTGSEGNTYNLIEGIPLYGEFFSLGWVPQSLSSARLLSERHRDVKLYVPVSTPRTPQTISFLINSAAHYGDADLNPQGVSDSGLEIVYESDNEAVATIVDGKIRITGAGEAKIRAAQPGNSAYEAAIPVEQTLVVLRKEINVSLNDIPAISKVYNRSNNAVLSAENYQLNGLVPGDDVTVSGTGFYETAGAGSTIRVNVADFVMAGADKDNYSITNISESATGIIKPKLLMVSLNALPVITKEYDGTSSAALVAGNYKLDGLISGDIVTLSGDAVYDTKTAGEDKAVTINNLVLVGDQSANYMLFNTSAMTAGVVKPKALTIKADDKEKFQGAIVPMLTVSYDGFVMGETSEVLRSQPVTSTIATINSPQGNYPILVSGASAANYTITHVNGTLKVNYPAPTSIALIAKVLYENQPAGTVAAELSSTSLDPNASFSYTLVNGKGDNALFAISGNLLKTASVFDYEQKASYTVVIKSSTQYGQGLEREFVVHVGDINEAPTLATVGDLTVCASNDMHTIVLRGISAGPESTQVAELFVSSNASQLFDQLYVQYSSGSEGTLMYRLKEGAAGSAIISLKVKDNGGTENGGEDEFDTSFNVLINTLPVAVLSSDDGTSISKGAIAHLSASGGSSYHWSDADGILAGQNGAVLTVRPEKTTTYTVTVINDNGCSSQGSLTVEVADDYKTVDANNLMSPNGDGVNDKFVIRNLDMYPNNILRMYDREGRLVYNKSDYQNDWDGTFKGLQLKEGTYYYIVELDGGKGKLKGFVTIVGEQK